MSEAAVAVHELTVRFGDVVAVDRLSFEGHRGEILAVLGANGAGKTTTVETLEGYRRPTAGSVRVLGLDPRRDRSGLTPRIGVMLQDGGVYTGIRVREALHLFAAYYPRPEDPDVLLDRVGLADRGRRTWRSLSGGERQRLSLALALIGQPEVAFLDEPTAGVDPAGRQVIRALVRELRERGVCVVLTTHDLDDAQTLADRVVIVDRGRLVAAGTPAELRRDVGGGDLLFGAAPGLPVAELATVLGHAVVERQPGEYHIDAPGDPRLVAALTAWLADRDLSLADLRAGRKGLEDVFLRLTAGDEGDGAGDPAGEER